MSRRISSPLPLILLMFVGFGVAGWGVFTEQTIRQIDDSTSVLEASQPSVVETIEIGTNKVAIPDWSFFKNGALWSLTSKQAPLPKDFIQSLSPAPLLHADADMKVATQIVEPLKALVAAAQADGVDLMASSAYRSYDDQQRLYDLYYTARGREFTSTHVATAGTSEHQTGLAIDISTVTNQCKENADLCTLQPAGIAWIQQNAARFGFIQRYPIGKQSITGIAGEEWHYRYVGPVLAKALTNNNITLDEFVTQAALGYSY